MFGEGSGTDLLRTEAEADCNEVWELKIKGVAAIHKCLVLVRSRSRSCSDEKCDTMSMWEWSKIHKNTHYRDVTTL